MRRFLIVLALLATACSGGDDGVTATGERRSASTGDGDLEAVGDIVEPTDEPAIDEPETDEPETDESDAGDGTASIRPDGPALPGLLDLSDEPVPNDDTVRTGEFSNGLRYYVRRNDNPGGKADLRLVVRAGSVDEFGPSTGTAHFVEHMLFNGTERFPENELIEVLRSFGASFGPDVNAYTSFDETVYSLVVPNDAETVELGLDVLAEWLSAATFDPEQVVSERGVVLDEWRVRTQTTGGRLFQIASEMYLGGSPYEGRLPIGTDDSITAMEETELRAYYDAWYRPDNVALIVVGDIDIAETEADIARRFGDEPTPDEALRRRPDTTFDLPVAPDFRLHSDPDQQTVDVEVTLPLPTFTTDGMAAQRAGLLDVVVFDILVQRLRRDLAEGAAPFDDVTQGSNSFVSDLDAPALYAFTDADRVRDTLVALLDEYQRAFVHGFTPAEVETSASTVRSVFETRFEGRTSTQDRVFGDALVEHFLRDVAYPPIDVEFELATAELDAMTPAAVHERFAARWANTWPHVIISSPDSSADLMPGEDEVIELIEATYGRDVPLRADLRDLPDTLMQRPESVEPTSITSLTDDGFAVFDPVVVTFDNGVRVVLNTNRIVAGETFFSAASPGGTSLVADEDVIDALSAADIVTSGGVAEFNQSEVAQILAGADTEVRALLTPYQEQFAGSSPTADLEMLFQLVHLYMTEPRFDPVALDRVVAAERPVVVDPSTDPNMAGYDTLLDTRYADEPRYTVIPDAEQFATLDLDGVARVWNQRYGDAGDWVFAFSGDFDPDEVIDLAGSYLGTLPGTGTVEQPIDVAVPPPTEVVEREVVAGSGDTASVSLLFTSPVDELGPSIRAHADVVSSLLRARLSDVIRERFGESYSPFAVSYFTTDPDPVIETYVEVSGAPDRIGQIADLVVTELRDLRDNGPTASEFANAFAEIEEEYGFVDNGQFLTAMIDDQIDPALPVEDYLDQYLALFGVDTASVTDYLGRHVSPDAYVQVTVVPR